MRPAHLRRLLGALALVAASLCAPAPAAATHDGYPSTFTGAEYLSGTGTNGTGGGLLERGGRYYMMTVAHVTGALGTDVVTNSRHIGTVAYRSTAKDIALIDMGTARPDPSLRIRDNVNGIPVVWNVVGNGGDKDWAQGSQLCTSGWTTVPSGAWELVQKCGYANHTLTPTSCASSLCAITGYSGGYIAAAPDAGWSGSVVWQATTTGNLKFMGIVKNCLSGSPPCTSAGFVPAYVFVFHAWTAAETLTGYPTGCCSAIQQG